MADPPAPEVDIAVIGGGIHGAGVAQAAAAAGYRVRLLEKGTLAQGTSSRSSKLVHGGLRYLETGDLRLVREALRERAHLLRNAPKLVRLVPFHIPVYRTTRRRPWKIRAGLSLYAILGGLRREARYHAVPRNEWARLDGLRTDGLQVVFRYQDGQTDDVLLTRAVADSARGLGAELLENASFQGAEQAREGYRVSAVHAGRPLAFTARCLVNAAGPWAPRVHERIHPRTPLTPVDLVQGAHVRFEGSLTHGVYYTESPRDQRAVFVMPWKAGVLVGTTETLFTGDPDEVRPLPEEIEYLTEIYRHYFPSRREPAVEAFAGLRVLPRSSSPAFVRSRETILDVDDARCPTRVAILGGKLTTYRATAARVVARLRPSLPPRDPVADTARLPLAVPGE